MQTLWTVEELTHHLFPSTFLIDPVVPRGGLVLMYGKREIGKSHCALTLAACITAGGVLFGRYRTRRGPVVYIQSDMSAPLQQKRIRATISKYSLTDLHFAFPDFLSLPNMKEDDELVQRMQELEPELIIWDTLRQIHRMDMNSDETPAWVYGTAKHLFPGTTHLFIHHDKKTIADQEKLDDEESFRGSGAWLDNVDTGIKLKSIGQGKLFLEFSKVRTCPRQPPLTLSLHPETMLLYAMGETPNGLIERWQREHPGGKPAELENFLLSCFVAPPRTVRALVEMHMGNGRGLTDRLGLGRVGTSPAPNILGG